MNMKLVMMITTIFLGVGNWLNAQVTTGTIMGKVFEEDSVTIVIGARVWVETETGVIGASTDFEGRYKIVGLKPGSYNVNAKLNSFAPYTVNGVSVSPDGLTHINFALGRTLNPVIVTWTPPLIEKDIPKLRIFTEDIAHSPYIRDPKGLLAGTSSEIQMPEGTDQLIIRGSRPGDAIYYIDGVKATDMSALPGVAIGSMEAYTGGIPAKYGDTTGGVVILESKSYFDLYNAWLAKQ